MLPLLESALPAPWALIAPGGPSSIGDCGNEETSAGSAEGPRRCLLRYTVEDTDRGRFGRGDSGAAELSVQYDGVLLRLGLAVFDGAGDCWCAGGVYGIPTMCRECGDDVISEVDVHYNKLGSTVSNSFQGS